MTFPHTPTILRGAARFRKPWRSAIGIGCAVAAALAAAGCSTQPKAFVESPKGHAAQQAKWKSIDSKLLASPSMSPAQKAFMEQQMAAAGQHGPPGRRASAGRPAHGQ